MHSRLWYLVPASCALSLSLSLALALAFALALALSLSLSLSPSLARDRLANATLPPVKCYQGAPSKPLGEATSQGAPRGGGPLLRPNLSKERPGGATPCPPVATETLTANRRLADWIAPKRNPASSGRGPRLPLPAWHPAPAEAGAFARLQWEYPPKQRGPDPLPCASLDA